MSPWPGAPKSQQSPPINAPSVRTPPTLTETSTMKDVAEAMNTAFDGLTVHEQAFASLPKQIAAQATAAATAAVENITQETVTGVTSFNAQTGAILYFPGLGTVNNQLGEPSYTPVQGDAGAKIIVGDSSAVAVFLDSTLSAPWFTIIGNDSSATADLVGPVNGLQSIYPGGFAIIFFDGTEFWAEGVAIATDSSLGVVQPDGVTIGIDSGGVISTIGATGTIMLAALTDSGATGQINVQNGLITSFVNPS
jgi:hypothetical protein